MQALLTCCCGVDVHRDMLEACILKGITDEPEPIRARFKTTQADLINFITWLKEHACFHVAMESTGVYWRPVYEAIEKYFSSYESLLVVNAHHMRNLPGCKSDTKDAEWIATLLRHGLLKPSFIPERVIPTLREYSRIYKTEIQEKSRLLNRLEKFLQSHGFKLSSVLSNITGTSGRKILYQLADKGFITATEIKASVNKHVKCPIEEIEAAVCGELELFERKLLKHFLEKLDLCEKSIAKLLEDMQELANPYNSVLEKMDSIPGVDLVSSLLILAETGANPSNNFKTHEHLCSWAGLSPRNDESAGKIKSKKILHGNSYIKSILCQVAWAAVRCRGSCFAVWFWSHQGKLGRKKAIIAVARKILSLIYLLIQRGEMFDHEIPISPLRKKLTLT
jgi:transposase